MTNIIPSHFNCFEEIKHINDHGIEYWSARDLQPVFGYTRWLNFKNTLDKAEESCKASWVNVDDHFLDVRKMIDLGKGAVRNVEDILLTRYAAYLVAQNGIASKPEIALAQAYFTQQTLRQEHSDKLSEDQKRLYVRNEVTERNRHLFDAAKESGVTNYGSFYDEGYRGLYGMRYKDVAEKKGLGKDKLLDRAGTTELAANLFRITQTEEQLRKAISEKGIIGQKASQGLHFKVWGKVRQTMKDIGNTLPEDLLAEEHVKQLEKRIKLDQGKISSPAEKPLKIDNPRWFDDTMVRMVA